MSADAWRGRMQAAIGKVVASADKPQTAGHGRNAIVAGLLLALGLGRLATGRRRPQAGRRGAGGWLDGSAGGANRALRLPAQDTLNTGTHRCAIACWETWATGRHGLPGWLFYRDGLRPGPACMCSTSACA